MPTQIHTSDTDPKQKPLHPIHTLIDATLLLAVLGVLLPLEELIQPGGVPGVLQS